MLSTVKHYDINTKLDLASLINAKFVNGGNNKEIETPKMTFSKVIFDDIELNIELPIGDLNNILFDELKNIKLIDTDIRDGNLKLIQNGKEVKEPEGIYKPFYDNTTPTPYLTKLVNAYNSEMDNFVRLGVFKEKVKELGD